MLTKIRVVLSFTALVFLVLIDQIVKFFVVTRLRGGQDVSFGFVDFVYYQNTGIAFGIPISGFFVLIFAVLLLGLLFWYYRHRLFEPLVLWSLTFIVAGAFGNGLDRVMRGHVVDYVSIWMFPVFNIADVLVVAGVLFLLLDELFLTSFQSKANETDLPQ